MPKTDIFYSDLASHILKGTANPVSGEVGRRILSIVDAAKESIETGQTTVPQWEE